MPIIGNLMLLAWPLVMLILFARLRLQHAVIWSILGGYLLLPERLGWNLPMIPNLDKHSIPALTAIGLTMLYLYRRRPGTLRARGIQDRQPPPYTVLKGWLPRSPAGLLLLGMIVLGAIASVLTNGDRLVYGPTVIPGLRPYDAMSSLAVIGFTLMPLLLGRKLLADNDSHRTLIFILCYAAMAYSLLALWEIRMSPRLNFQIYGFFPHSWIQHIRGDGFRPLVFLRHGLLLGVFMACGILAAAVCMRLDQKRRTLFLLATFWLLGTLALSKTLGAFLIALALLPVVVLMPVRLQLVAAAIVAGITLSYPILRGAGWIPVDRISEIAMSYDEGRAGSLIFRLENEDILLEKANERPIFGWGGWGRWRVYDDRTGNDVSTSDGSWIILIGEGGWVGYIGLFGLLTIPVILFALRRRRYGVGLATSGLSLVMAANLIDNLPNDSLTPVLWLMAGAMVGRLELAGAKAGERAGDRARNATAPGRGRRQRPPPDPVADPVPAGAGLSAYTRFSEVKQRQKPG